MRATRSDGPSQRPPLTQAGEKAVQVLLAFSPEAPELSLAQLATRLGLNRGSVYRAVATLERHGLLEAVGGPRQKRYRVGLRAFQVGTLYLAGVSFAERALPILRELMEQSGCTAQLGVPDGQDSVIVASVESSAMLRVVAGLGERNPAHASSFGKLFLAERSDQGLSALLDAGELPCYTTKTIVDPGALRAELARVRAQGYAFNDEEWHPGVAALAAPVHDHTGQVVAGLGIAAPMHFMPRERRDELIRLTRRAAERLSEALGARAPTTRARRNGREVAEASTPSHRA